MIYRKEIIPDEDYVELEEDIKSNINTLLEKINKLRAAYGRPMLVTSGFRTLEHHLAIYAKKGITDKKRIPMQSKHLYGQAIDIADQGGFLQDWIKKNEEFLEKLDLYMEDFSVTTNWVHFQIVPPKSGKRFFMP